jgi:hypothetical protein
MFPQQHEVAHDGTTIAIVVDDEKTCAPTISFHLEIGFCPILLQIKDKGAN